MSAHALIYRSLSGASFSFTFNLDCTAIVAILAGCYRPDRQFLKSIWGWTETHQIPSNPGDDGMPKTIW